MGNVHSQDVPLAAIKDHKDHKDHEGHKDHEADTPPCLTPKEKRLIREAPDPEGNTLLINAVKGDYPMARMLIAGGANVNAKNHLQESVFAVANKSNCPDLQSKWAIIKLLNQKGARLQKANEHLKINLDHALYVKWPEHEKAEIFKIILNHGMYSIDEISNGALFKSLSLEYQADIEDYAGKMEAKKAFDVLKLFVEDVETRGGLFFKNVSLHAWLKAKFDGILNQNSAEGGQKPWYGIFLPFMQLNAENTDPYGMNNIRKISTDSAQEEEGQKQEDQEPLLVELNQADHTPLPDADADRPSPRSFGL